MSRHRDRLDVHYARDDFADRDALVRTLSRDRAKDMASDYADTFVERGGWARPEREMATPSPEPARDPERERRLARLAAFQRHARAVAAMFQAQEGGLPLAGGGGVWSSLRSGASRRKKPGVLVSPYIGPQFVHNGGPSAVRCCCAQDGRMAWRAAGSASTRERRGPR